MIEDINDEEEWDEYGYEPNEELQREYESALGKFLVAFNNIESSLGWLIEEAIKKAGRDSVPKEIKDNDNYSFKVNVLDLISLFSKRVASEELVNELRQLGERRNKLAHGRFHIDSYDLTQKISHKDKMLHMPLKEINKLAERAQKADHDLQSRACFLYIDPEDIVTFDTAEE